jgi:hypothetical protein
MNPKWWLWAALGLLRGLARIVEMVRVWGP